MQAAWFYQPEILQEMTDKGTGPGHCLDPAQHFLNRSRIALKPDNIKANLSKGLAPDVLKDWAMEIANPSTPAPYNLVHKFKHLTKAPPLPCDWTCEDFVR